ncbi:MULTISPECIES: FAD-binding oxidoreductase [Bacillus]|uniref:FAD-binding oxidoreductase n=1 Tax=Bacillus pumilus TaxID=1408 RepID=A0A2G8IR31_BACPU|nr:MULTISPECIES: FAD-binding oxidoreductase [Bacillus]MED1748664.1 FAD-binding oxidoreductase [Bacillus zhangzhouensis]PIK25923.1 FAD-binding oxidoreductase [Bacillus pumilus]
MKRKWIWIVLFMGYAAAFFASITIREGQAHKSQNLDAFTDVSHLMPVKIKKVVQGKEIQTLKEVLEEAKEKHLPISIAGKQHSMGGHTYYENGIVLDMTKFRQILAFDENKQTIRVQSGATWDDIQKFVNPYGLAVKVMQSQNIFTVGGSLSANAHGRDIRYGSLIDTVRSFRLLKADGEIITVKPDDDLFTAVIGGYGLFGVILDVELSLTRDELYKMETTSLDYREYTAYFQKHVKDNKEVRMHLARISTAKKHFLKEMYVTNYTLSSDQEIETYRELKEDQLVMPLTFMLGLSRKFDMGKDLLWNLQKKYFQSQNGQLITRNNVMRSDSAFLEYENESDTDVLQEYFVPVDRFRAYIDEMRDLLQHEELNLMNITIRYVQKNEKADLSYAKQDMFALVLLVNYGFEKEEKAEAKRIIRQMTDVTLRHHGSYYLPYMPYQTKAQMKRAYPKTDVFFQKKKQADPDGRFINYFYERYNTQ